MNVVFVYPAPSSLKQCRFGYSLTLLYLASLSRNLGCRPAYVDFSLELSAQQRLHELLRWADVVVVEFDTFSLKRSRNVSSAQDMVAKIRARHPSVKIVACGRDCIVRPRHVPFTDITITSEPEAAMHHIVASKGTKCPTVFAPESPFVPALDTLPFPARDLLTEDVVRGGAPFGCRLAPSALIETSRGCPGNCRFCERKAWRYGIRYRSADSVIREFEELRRQGIVNVWVTDENFGGNLIRAKEVLAALAKSRITQGMRLALSTWVHIDQEFLEVARLAGVSILSFGLESVDQAILSFYRKHVDYSKLSKILASADEIGIFTVGNFILGAPMESPTSIHGMFEAVKTLPLDEVNVKILTYMPGSDLYAELPEEKQTKGDVIFGCSEEGLCRFSYHELVKFANEIVLTHRQTRSYRLQAKVRRFGPPYYWRGH